MCILHYVEINWHGVTGHRCVEDRTQMRFGAQSRWSETHEVDSIKQSSQEHAGGFQEMAKCVPKY